MDVKMPAFRLCAAVLSHPDEDFLRVFENPSIKKLTGNYESQGLKRSWNRMSERWISLKAADEVDSHDINPHCSTRESIMVTADL